MPQDKIVHAAPVPPFVSFVASAVPMVFDNSMSYYEALCALWKWMQDNLVDVINNNASVTEHYIELTNALKEYVENYFANLDVQEEINNKLDQMAEDGTLQEIITAYIQANVAWTFDTVADMKSATNLVAGSYAQTLGFYSIGDGGGALYRISDTGTANEMDVISVNSLYAILVTPITFNPILFGAYGDGLHDDAVSIRRAIEYIDAIGGGKLDLLDNKTYILDTADGDHFFELCSNLTISGNSTLKIKDNHGDFGFLFKLTKSVDNVKFTNFTINENTTNNPVTEYTSDTDKKRTLLRLIAPTSTTFNNVIIDNVKMKDCIGVWQIELEGESNNVLINNCTIELNDTTVSYDRTSIYFGVINGSIQNCRLYGNNNGRTAIELHGINNTCKNNYINGYASGIYTENDDSTKTGNTPLTLTISENDINVSRKGVYIWQTASDRVTDCINVINNTINIYSSTETSYICGIGFEESFAANTGINTLNIDGNTITSENSNIKHIKIHNSQNNLCTLKQVNIINNKLNGVTNRPFEFYANSSTSLACDELNILNNIISFNTSSHVFYFLVYSNFKKCLIKDNHISGTVSSYVIQVSGNAGSDYSMKYIDNMYDNYIIDKIVSTANTALNPLFVLNLNTSSLVSSSTANFLDGIRMNNGSHIENTNFQCHKANNKWFMTYHSTYLIPHCYFTKGTLCSVYNSAPLLRVVKGDSYSADHVAGTNAIGDWVYASGGTEVYESLTINSITTPSAGDNFKLIGNLVTFTDINA